MSDTTDCVLTPRVPTDGFDPLGVGTHRASTITFKDAAAYAARGQRGDKGYSYGLYGTPTTRTLEEKLRALNGLSEPSLCLRARRPMHWRSCPSSARVTMC
jgi:cysteine-S-conjugate beta-lyase